jgi:hypothetical protein
MDCINTALGVGAALRSSALLVDGSEHGLGRRTHRFGHRGKV